MDLILSWRELNTPSTPENTERGVKIKEVHFQASEIFSQAFPEV